MNDEAPAGGVHVPAAVASAGDAALYAAEAAVTATAGERASGDADGAEHVGRLEGGRRTSTATGHSNVFKCHEERLALHVGKAEVEVADVSLLLVAVQNHVGNARFDGRFEFIAEVGDPGVIKVHILLA